MTPTMSQRRLNRFANRRFWALASLAVPGLALLGLVGGCATASLSKSPAQVGTTGLVPANNFVTVASSKVSDDGAPIKSIHLVGDAVLVYSQGPQGTRVTSFSRALNLRWARNVGTLDDQVRAPVRIGDRFIFPTEISFEIITTQGVVERTQTLPHAITTPLSVTSGGFLLAGTASPTGGRAALIDPTRQVLPIVRDVLLGDIISRPVEFQDTVYAATVDGKVFAIGANNTAVWPLKDGAFVTDKSVSADLVVDEFGLYVAAADSKLYVLDRITGRVKWRYFAQSQLTRAPFVTADRVYQPVGKGTLVALDKIEGDPNRRALWTIEGVDQVVAADASFVYVVQGGTVAAVEKSTGQVKFTTRRGDLKVFATNTVDSTIYAINAAGEVIAFRPVLSGAAAGEFVLLPVSIARA